MPCASVNSFRCVFRRRFFGCPNIYYNDHVAVFVCFTLLVESGDVELNSGPCEEQASAESTMISRKTPTWKHPCALCSKPVRSNQKGILCDFCDRWHHIKCINMDLKTYVALSSSEEEWRCYDCTTPSNFTDSFFEASHTTDDLLTDDNSEVSTTNRTNSFPKCLLVNTRSVHNKVFYLQALLLMDSFHIVAITETWLDSDFGDHELLVDGFNIFRKDRESQRGGGVLLAVINHLPCSRRSDLEVEAEMLVLEI